METLLQNVIEAQHEKRQTRDIWKDSQFKHVAELENDDVGKIGESYIQTICDNCSIDAEIDGTKTKKVGGGIGDGTIKGKSVEIKCARAGTGKIMSFQHELGEKPWHADYMVFLDISPNKFYLTIFPNFTEEQYKSCCKCEPYFPSRAFCWRKHSGCFKFDTTEPLNEKQGSIENSNTFIWDSSKNLENIAEFINRIIV